MKFLKKYMWWAFHISALLLGLTYMAIDIYYHYFWKGV